MFLNNLKMSFVRRLVKNLFFELHYKSNKNCLDDRDFINFYSFPLLNTKSSIIDSFRFFRTFFILIIFDSFIGFSESDRFLEIVEESVVKGKRIPLRFHLKAVGSSENV